MEGSGFLLLEKAREIILMSRHSRRSSTRRSLNTLDAEEYRTDEEILAFKPLDVIDGLINSVHDSVCDIIDETEQSVSAKYPDHVASVQQVRSNVRIVMKLSGMIGI